jgi:hypothetical protein
MDRGPWVLSCAIVAVGLAPAIWLGSALYSPDSAPAEPRPAVATVSPSATIAAPVSGQGGADKPMTVLSASPVAQRTRLPRPGITRTGSTASPTPTASASPPAPTPSGSPDKTAEPSADPAPTGPSATVTPS